jgi:hypothetical protein
MKRPVEYLLLLFLIAFSTGCGVYSFTGASIPAGAKTVSIEYFVNNAPLVEPTLSQALTDALRDRFLQQTPLNLVRENGDLQFEGVITDYSTRPVAIQGNETAALNRLTVQVKVRFTNVLEPDKDYESTFTQFQDYESTQDLSQVKDDLLQIINEALVDDIFNKSVVNW